VSAYRSESNFLLSTEGANIKIAYLHLLAFPVTQSDILNYNLPDEKT
jgi:hypothetical protein